MAMLVASEILACIVANRCYDSTRQVRWKFHEELAMKRIAALTLVCGCLFSSAIWGQEKRLLRAGIIGLDTSHVVEFTRLLNNPKNGPDLEGVRVVAAFPGGSTDVASSRNRVEGFTKRLRDEFKVEIVGSIDDLLAKVDVVLLESVDGRPHLSQVLPVLKAGKLVFIDKPIAGSLADVLLIFEFAQQYKTPLFSSSSLRYYPGIGAAAAKNQKTGAVLGCVTYGPCELEEHHPDLFWYGIHGVEALFTIMGTACDTVTRTHTQDTDVATGVWKDGRVGAFRGIRKAPAPYDALVFGSKGVALVGGQGGYEPLVKEIVKFFKTGRPPVSAEETIAIFAFMEAADESKRQGGAPVRLESVLEKAQVHNAKRRLLVGQEEEGFVPLFSGKDFSGWRFSPASAPDKLPRNWSVADGLIKLAGDGSPHLASQWDYDDFEVRLQWKAYKKGYNSGFYVRSGRAVNANQINLAETDCGHLINSSSKGGPKVPELQKPVGQWNDWRVRVVGSKLTFWCNGQKAWEVEDFQPARGYLGLQAEGAQIDFRNIRVKELGFHNVEPVVGKGAVKLSKPQSKNWVLRLEWKAAKTPTLTLGGREVEGAVGAMDKVANPAGQFNYLQVTMRGGQLIVWMNGADIATANDWPNGALTLQGEEVMVQNLRARQLP
jgi:predicted dehydrogenase